MNIPIREIFLNSWYDSLEDPPEAQHRLFQELIQRYRETEYGRIHHAHEVETVDDFRTHFPPASFSHFSPYIDKIKEGMQNTLVAEKPISWGMTRGTTGPSKIIPYTEAEIEERFILGPRCLMNYVHKSGNTQLFDGHILLLVYPPEVGTEEYKGMKHTYGYSSGIYSKQLAEKVGLNLVYSVDELAQFGTRRVESESRNRLAYILEQARDKEVTAIIGIAQLMILLGKVAKKLYGIYPKDMWHPLLITSSLPNVHARYNPALKAIFKYTALRDIYGATEGFYAQQLDERPYSFPNYDYYFFEVQIGKKVKMLHEMKKGERGSLIVSSHLFPRYRIGDIVKSFGDGGIACISREKDFNIIKYYYDRLMGYSL
jgi:hypothetical protein